MSDYVSKLLKGVQPSSEEWERLLIEAHRNAPQMSPAAFAECKDSQGCSSYQWAAESVRGLKSSTCVVDLACGDGFLIPLLQSHLPSSCSVFGIDMAESGLELARARKLPGLVEFRRARAQETGLKSNSVDAVVCHMGFMLMLPIEQVVDELMRVLKPGGLFTAVVSNRSVRTGPFKEVLDIVSKTLHEKFPKMASPATGDPRTETEEGMNSLFEGRAEIVSTEDRFFGRNVDANGVWNQVKDMYLIGGLPSEVKVSIREEVLSAFQPRGVVRFEFAFRRFVLRKI